MNGTYRRVAITGGPGSGKTTMLAGLQRRGYPVVPDSARALIVERMAAGLPPRPDPAEFARQLVAKDIEQYASLPTETPTAFFDRCLIDSLGMLDDLNLLTKRDLSNYLARFPFEHNAFILPPWEEIYRTDSERDQSFADAVRIYERILDWYSACAYDLIVVPCSSAEARCEFVLEHLDRHTSTT